MNYRYVNKVDSGEFDQLITDLQSGQKAEIPKHGALAKTRQQIQSEELAGPAEVENASPPEWLQRNEDEQ